MGNKRLGCICFFIADFSEKSQRIVKLINYFGNVIPGSIMAIVADDSIKLAQESFSDRIKLYNVSMNENREGKAVIKALIKIAKPELLLIQPSDVKATSFAQYAKLDSRFIVFGQKMNIGNEEITVVEEEAEAATFIIRFIESEKKLDFYPKYYAHEKALNSQIQPGDLWNSIFHHKKRVESDFFDSWGYKLPVNPRTYNEKLNRLKIEGHYRRYRRYTDKHKVRVMLKKMGYESLLPECYAVVNFNISNEIWNLLPNKFVIKHSNSSGYNIVIDDKNSADLNVINRVLTSFKHVKYGVRKNEPVYSFNGRVLCTEYLDNLTDYKFFCFKGRVRFVAIVKEWLKESPLKEPYQIIVDRDFKELPFSYGYERGTISCEKPAYYDQMLHTVEVLAKNIPHVRLDMMGNNERFYFGEFTFFPGGGRDRFNPPDYDLVVGEYLD